MAREGGLLKSIKKNDWIQRCTSAGMAREGGKRGGLMKPVKKYWIQRCTSAGMAREGGKAGGLLKPIK